jgi:hypothetical protein
VPVVAAEFGDDAPVNPRLPSTTHRPVAAWLVEKWRSWTNNDGGPERSANRDFLLELATIYGATETITTSPRDYHDNRWHGGPIEPDDRVTIPTATLSRDHPATKIKFCQKADA